MCQEWCLMVWLQRSNKPCPTQTCTEQKESKTEMTEVSQAGSWNWGERPVGVLLGNCSNVESTSKATLCSPHSFCCVPVGQSGLRSAHFHPLPHGCVLMGLPAFTLISVTS